MGKKILKAKKKTAGTFIRLEPAFKKRAHIYAIEHDTNLTELIVNGLMMIMDSKNT